MKKSFRDFATYIRLHDGHGKPRLNWQHMYQLFPALTFTASPKFGQYSNFGEAYEHKDYTMLVTDQDGNECTMVYREYYETMENLAYVS